jgi:predicted metal-binding membrane protein
MLIVQHYGGPMANGHETPAALCRAGLTSEWYSMADTVHLSGVDMAGWFLMLMAMMSPTLISPLQHLWERSFRRRRLRAMGLFATGYALIWMVAGIVFLEIAAIIELVLPLDYFAPLALLLTALVWQCSPFKQICLNRNHNHSELRGFGMQADADAFGFGLIHGFWCLGSCWALMLFPMLFIKGHLAVMGLVTLIMLSESLERPKPPCWRIYYSGKLLSIMKWQLAARLGRRISVGE